jgi:hypothetical protein
MTREGPYQNLLDHLSDPVGKNIITNFATVSGPAIPRAAGCVAGAGWMDRRALGVVIACRGGVLLEIPTAARSGEDSSPTVFLTDDCFADPRPSAGLQLVSSWCMARAAQRRGWGARREQRARQQQRRCQPSRSAGLRPTLQPKWRKDGSVAAAQPAPCG